MIVIENRRNVCDQVGDSGAWRVTKAHRLRANIKPLGWTYVDGEDFCRRCSDERRWAKKEVS